MRKRNINLELGNIRKNSWIEDSYKWNKFGFTIRDPNRSIQNIGFGLYYIINSFHCDSQKSVTFKSYNITYGIS